MGNGGSRLRKNGPGYEFFNADQGSGRWRDWACGHDRSVEYDGSSTLVRRSWFGRLPQQSTPKMAKGRAGS